MTKRETILLEGEALGVALQLHAVDTNSTTQMNALTEEANAEFAALKEKFDARAKAINAESLAAATPLLTALGELTGKTIASDNYADGEDVPLGDTWIVDGTHIENHGIAFLVKDQPHEVSHHHGGMHVIELGEGGSASDILRGLMGHGR